MLRRHFRLLTAAALTVSVVAACSAEDPAPPQDPPASCPFDYGTFTPSPTPVSLKQDLVPIMRRACAGNTCHASSDDPAAELYLGPRRAALHNAPPDACGDRKCDAAAGETTETCALDCGACGDGACGANEVTVVCAGSKCDGTCGDDKCGTGETVASCEADCSDAACGNGVCNLAENADTCPRDCGVLCPADCAAGCGDRVCADGETPALCPRDCSAARCGDGTCSGENAATCPFDCGSCGDGTCGFEETATKCPADCTPGCGDNVCGDGEAEASCPVDCLPQSFYDALHAELVGADSKTAKLPDGSPMKVVVAGDAAASFTMLKLDGCQNSAGLTCQSPDPKVKDCGARMPNVVGGTLSVEERALFRSWIQQGAPNN